MQLTVVDSNKARLHLDAPFRSGRRGPEHQLVQSFLQVFPVAIPADCAATVFCEPRVESSFPDLVLVLWHVGTAYNWSPARRHLTTFELRLLHHLYQSGPSDIDDLESVFGGGVEAPLEKLEDADTVVFRDGEWRPRRLSENFAARQIMAFEAKMSEWSDALDQATLNTWFASDSCVLMPRVPRGSSLLKEARTRGIGVWTQDGQLEPGVARSRGFPLSYASWMFNEWAWRVAASLGRWFV